MGFYQQFDQFDPKTDNVPYHPFSLLPNIVWRARSILNKRSHDEILTAAQLADWMIDDYFQQEAEYFIQEQLQGNGWACKYINEEQHKEAGLRDLIRRGLPDNADPNEYFDFPTSDSTTEVDALKACIDSYDIEDDGFKDAKQHEYFAVLALWLVGDCLSWLRKGKQQRALTQLNGPGKGLRKILTDETISLSIAGQSALLAMDAVCYAEHLKAAERHFENIATLRKELHQREQSIEAITEEKVAQRRSQTAREAAAKRHEENVALREQAIQHYEANEGRFPSMEAAAREISTKIVPVTTRTVVDWIRAHKKQRSAGRL